MPTRCLSVDQVAELLGEHPETVRERLRRGELKGGKRGDGPRARWFVTEKTVEAYIQRCMRV